MSAEDDPERPGKKQKGPKSASVVEEPDEADSPTEAPEDPADGEEHAENVVLVHTGLVRVLIGGNRYRLRRPFFGEFREIRTRLQDVTDEIADASDRALRVSREITEEAKDAEDLPADEWEKWRQDARRRSTEAGRSLTARSEDLRLDWWESMWDRLSLDGRPDEWPMWVADGALANSLVTHWRSSPLGRG